MPRGGKRPNAGRKKRTPAPAIPDRAVTPSTVSISEIVQPLPAVSPVTNSSLTPSQDRFVAEYLVDLNATQAAIRAGYSPVSAESLGYQLLQKPLVAAAVAEGKARQLQAIGLRADMVLEEIRRVAFVNSRDYWNADGTAKHPTELTEEQGACLAGFEVLIKNAKAGDGVTDTVHKFKLWDKVHSLELLAKHFKLLTDKVEIHASDDLLSRLDRGRQRGQR